MRGRGQLAVPFGGVGGGSAWVRYPRVTGPVPVTHHRYPISVQITGGTFVYVDLQIVDQQECANILKIETLELGELVSNIEGHVECLHFRHHALMHMLHIILEACCFSMVVLAVWMMQSVVLMSSWSAKMVSSSFFRWAGASHWSSVTHDVPRKGFNYVHEGKVVTPSEKPIGTEDLG